MAYLRNSTPAFFMAALLGAGLAMFSCSGGDSTEDSSGDTQGTSNGGAGTSNGGNNTGGIGFVGAGGNNTGGGNPNECAGENFSAEPVPVDIHIMLDRSGSMEDDSGQAGVSKWDAISSAFTSFVSDPGAAGLGVGLHYFPQNLAGVPDQCSSHAQCGAGGPCLISICEDDIPTVVPCENGGDCNTGACIPLGQCPFGGGLCAPVGSGCFPIGTCTAITDSFCWNQTSCVTADYTTPSVAIAALPGNAQAITDSIAATGTTGATPTSAALQGAIDHAITYATANPDASVSVVLATDGLPTRCDPQDGPGIAAIAAAALAGTPSISTFVIGIIGSGDPNATTLLDQVATAGGTNMAFIVDPNSQTLDTDFKNALDNIAGNVLACEYQIPEPDNGEMIDYAKVNVEHTPPGGSPTTVPYVGDAANCDPVTGGWYYDVDPNQGTPTTILLCDASCGVFSQGGEVEIVVGCETVVPQ